MSYILEHTTLGFCWWDLPAVIILIVVIVAFAWKHHDMKKQEKDLEDQISELYADDAVPLEGKKAFIVPMSAYPIVPPKVFIIRSSTSNTL